MADDELLTVLHHIFGVQDMTECLGLLRTGNPGGVTVPELLFCASFFDTLGGLLEHLHPDGNVHFRP